MKKIYMALFFFFLFCVNVTSIFGESDFFFKSLIGRSRSYIETYYPHYKVFNLKGDKKDGYYIIGGLDCKDSGKIYMLVGFDGKKQNSVVDHVVLQARKCREYITEDTMYSAGNTFVYMLGLDEYLQESKIFDAFPNSFAVVFPNNIYATIAENKDTDGNTFYEGTFSQLMK